MFGISIPRHMRLDYALALLIPATVIVLTALQFRDGVTSVGQVYGALVANTTAVVVSAIMLGFIRRNRHVVKFAGVDSETFHRFVSLLDDLGYADSWRDCVNGVTYGVKRDKNRLALHVSEEIRSSSGACCLLEKTYAVPVDGSGPVLLWDVTRNVQPDGTIEELSPDELQRSLARAPKGHMYVSEQELAELCSELEAIRPKR